MIVIDIDTIALESVVASAKTANEDIIDAAKLLNQIPQHTDWSCSEKNIINNNAQSNKDRVTKINNTSSMFLDNIRAMCNELSDAENNLPNTWSDLEGSLANILAGLHILDSIAQPSSIKESIDTFNTKVFLTLNEALTEFLLRKKCCTSKPIVAPNGEVIAWTMNLSNQNSYKVFENNNPARIIDFIDLKN